MNRRTIIAVLVGVALLVVGVALWAMLSRRTTSPPSPPAEIATTPPEAIAPLPAPGTPTPPPGPPPSQQGRAFVDHFASLDDDRWYLADRAADGWWMQSELRPSQVSTGPEGMALTLAPGGEGPDAPLLGAEVVSEDGYRYGYIESRWRAARGPGVISAVFTYANAAPHIAAQEIDIEIIGRNTRSAEFSFHIAGRSVGRAVALPFDAADGFHTYGIEWGPTFIRWYVDGRPLYEARDAILARMTRPQQIMFELWGSERLHEWVGRLDRSRAPWLMNVQCAAYAPSYPGHMICPER